MVDENFARRLAQDLVKIDSSDPGAYEGGIEHFIKRLIEKQLAQLDSPALDAVQIKEFEVLPGRHNLMVTVPGLSDEPRLVYICHMDTVLPWAMAGTRTHRRSGRPCGTTSSMAAAPAT